MCNNYFLMGSMLENMEKLPFLQVATAGLGNPRK